MGSSGDYEDRFGGVARLYGEAALARLRQAHVAVIGLGGVGSWTAEALARSGLGTLTLVDMDAVCVSNVNRQLPALTDTLGQPKAAILAERVRRIQPEITVYPLQQRFAPETAEALLSVRYDGVVDAIDNPPLKALLIASCCRRGIPIVVAGGAGGRRDPACVRVSDLAHASQDPLLAEARRRLRQEHGFPRGDVPFGIECVHSIEPIRYALPPVPVSQGTSQARAGGADRTRRRRFGTACFVTGTFGFVAAARVVSRLVGEASSGDPARHAG